MDAMTRHRIGDARVVVMAGEEDSPERLVMPGVEVHLADGSRWSATVATTADIDAIMARAATTGEDLGGRFLP